MMFWKHKERREITAICLPDLLAREIHRISLHNTQLPPLCLILSSRSPLLCTKLSLQESDSAQSDGCIQSRFTVCVCIYAFSKRYPLAFINGAVFGSTLFCSMIGMVESYGSHCCLLTCLLACLLLETGDAALRCD